MLPHLIWEQSATYTLAAICIHTCRVFGKRTRHICLRKLCEIPPRVWWRHTLMLSARPPVHAIWIAHAYVTSRTKPSSRLVPQNRAGVWKREFCTAEPSCFGKCESAAALFAELSWRTLKYSDKPWERRLQPGSISQAGVSAPHKRSGSSRSHWSKHLLYYLLAACRDKTKSFAHPCADAVRNVSGYRRRTCFIARLPGDNNFVSPERYDSNWRLNP